VTSRLAYDAMDHRDVVSWNSPMDYAQHGKEGRTSPVAVGGMSVIAMTGACVRFPSALLAERLRGGSSCGG
jgi:hypothetical protein